MTVKNEFLLRVYIVFFSLVLAAILIFGKAVKISVFEGEKWRGTGDSLYLKYIPVKAERGNIYADDGSPLATSLTFFEIRMDLSPKVVSDEVFDKDIDSLAWCLSKYLNNSYTPGGFKSKLIEARANGERYLLIKSSATYEDLEKIKTFPIFKLGRYRGGLIVVRHSSRKRPFNMLANRTIGYVREGAKPVGLEGYFDDFLAGDEGVQLMQKVIPNTYIPVNDLSEIEPKNGQDLVTNIDINLQDIVHQSLYKAMVKNAAKHGCAVMMEVETGAIKAISNLSQNKEGKYTEAYNHAVGTRSEPGSTFKLPSLMALMEANLISLDDTVDLEKGSTKFYDVEIRDASRHEIEETSIRNAFEISSNVGIMKAVNKHFGSKKGPEQFVALLEKMRLNELVNIEISGEAGPYIKEPYSKKDQWSGTTIPWMAIGYELMLTPLQVLTFYNAVANDGKMMKPYLVQEIRDMETSVKKFKPQVLKQKIASQKTIEKAKELLEGVVERGTAKRMKTDAYSFAGKTGTVQLDYKQLKSTKKFKHQASFVGYFPADKPKYSCIIVINDPKTNRYHGSDVALPVFREIADKSFAGRMIVNQALNKSPKPILTSSELPDLEVGAKEDFKKIMKQVNLPLADNSEREWAVVRSKTDSVQLLTRKIDNETVPNVKGMGLRDALFVLENAGLKVVPKGTGKVYKQSVKAGTKIKSQTVYINLQ